MPGSQKLTPPSSAMALCDDRVATKVIASNGSAELARAAGRGFRAFRKVPKLLIMPPPSIAAYHRIPQCVLRWQV